MKKGTTAIQNIEPETAESFRQARKKFEVEQGRDVGNDEFLQELLK